MRGTDDLQSGTALRFGGVFGCVAVVPSPGPLRRRAREIPDGADGAFPSHPYTKDIAEGRFETGVSRNNA